MCQLTDETTKREVDRGALRLQAEPTHGSRQHPIIDVHREAHHDSHSTYADAMGDSERTRQTLRQDTMGRELAAPLSHEDPAWLDTDLGEAAMYDEQTVDDAVLALLHLTAFDDHGVTRAWKTFDWAALDRLHERGLISDPKSKAKSIVFSEEGARLAAELFERRFGASQNG